MSWATLRDHIYALDLPPHLREVLLVLAKHADSDGSNARPSVTTIADHLGKSGRAVRSALRALREHQLIVPVGPRPAPGRTTTYTLLLFNGKPKAPKQEGLFASPDEQRRKPASPERRKFSVATEEAGFPLPKNDQVQQRPSVSVGSRDDAFEALAQSTGFEVSELTKDARGLLNGALKKIRRACPDLNGELPDEIRLRTERYRLAHPEWELTPSALAKWWPTLSTDRGPPIRRGFESAATQVLRQIHERGRRRDEPGEGGRAGLPAGTGLSRPSD